MDIHGVRAIAATTLTPRDGCPFTHRHGNQKFFFQRRKFLAPGIARKMFWIVPLITLVSGRYSGYNPPSASSSDRAPRPSLYQQEPAPPPYFFFVLTVPQAGILFQPKNFGQLIIVKRLETICVICAYASNRAPCDESHLRRCRWADASSDDAGNNQIDPWRRRVQVQPRRPTTHKHKTNQPPNSS